MIKQKASALAVFFGGRGCKRTNNCGQSKAPAYDEPVEKEKHKFDASTFNNACSVQNVHEALSEMVQGNVCSGTQPSTTTTKTTKSTKDASTVPAKRDPRQLLISF